MRDITYDTFDVFFPDQCCKGEAPFCSDDCPLQVDVRDFINKTKRGSLDAAYKTFRNAAIFPRIVAELCPHPCENRCPRAAAGGSIDLLNLERAAIKNARSLDPINFNVPAKAERIAVIGAGISGLACAIRLAAKRYQVTVFEKSDRIGGRLWDLMDSEVFLDDIATQGKYAPYELVLNRQITSLDELRDFDAVYIATGEGGESFGLTADADGNPSGGPDGVFIGGRILGADTVWAISQGAAAAINIEKYLKTGAMRFQPERPRNSRVTVDTDELKSIPRVQAAAKDGFSKEEAIEEADRCLRCDCTRCIDNCEFMTYYRTEPRKVANLIAFGLADHNLEPLSNNRMVNSCTDCGCCEQVCPFDIATGDQVMAARRQMFERKQIPPAYHYYWLRDMQHATSDEGSLFLPAPHGKKAKYLFFPGCQLGASDPRYPYAAYELLRRVEPQTAVDIDCCGAPAYWAGDAETHRQMLAKLYQRWQEAGKPTVVCACYTCLRLIRRFLPDIEAVSLYQVLAQAEGLQLPDQSGRPEYALVDPCSAKYDATAREDMLALADRMNVKGQPLYKNINKMPCCSFGGNIEGAKPDLARTMRESRVQADPRPYLSYCANCRDTFAREDKPVVHILDLLADLNPDDRRPPHIDNRRANRLQAKALFTGEEVIMPEPKIKLIISEEMQNIMDKKLIFADDIRQVIDYAETTGSKFIDDQGVNIAHLVIGLPTIWVEYVKAGADSYEVLNCYLHRMSMVEPGRAESEFN
ncbi:MAG: FAD-dependent oxidoreductase [Clostridia bacterium]|nr:FAD-dependent oxidoreductase [Clostridia bacterium]